MSRPRVHIVTGEPGCKQAAERKGITVIIDALRASVTLPVLFSRGAESVIVVPEVDDAFELNREDPSFILAGERGGIKIEGFHLGNSPTQISEADIEGRTIVFTSTTGSRRMVQARSSAGVFVGSVTNATAVARAVLNESTTKEVDIFLVAAGSAANPSVEQVEDLAAACFIAGRLDKAEIVEGGEIYQEYCNLFKKQELYQIFKNSPHGEDLFRLGFSDDVSFCSRVDILEAVPWVVGVITLASGRFGVRLENYRR